MKQHAFIAEAEIEELKESLHYVEIQLAQAREDKEGLEHKLDQSQKDLERNQDVLQKQIKHSQLQQKQIEELSKKIEGFNSNQKDVKSGFLMFRLQNKQDSKPLLI